VTDQPYEVDLTRTARRDLAERLPLDVAVGASDFIMGPLAERPHRIGKQLEKPLRVCIPLDSCGSGASCT